MEYALTPDPQKKLVAGDSGVADVRAVREKIAAQYQGDLRQHAADTDRLVEPLIEKLGLRRGDPCHPTARRSGTA
jgi:hypothetical protein